MGYELNKGSLYTSDFRIVQDILGYDLDTAKEMERVKRYTTVIGYKADRVLIGQIIVVVIT